MHPRERIQGVPSASREWVNGTIPIGHRSRNISREYHYRSLDSIREVTPLNGWECIGRASLALTMGPFGDNAGRPRDFMEPEARQGEKGNAGPKFLLHSVSLNQPLDNQPYWLISQFWLVPIYLSYPKNRLDNQPICLISQIFPFPTAAD